MTQEEVYNLIKVDRPRVVYLTGKTSIGKSTFANLLKDDFDYQIISLDNIVEKAVMEDFKVEDRDLAFRETYGERNKLDWIKNFVSLGQNLIQENLKKNKPVIIEGALANSETLKEFFSEYVDFEFIYFHPKNIDIYKRNLLSRFKMVDEINRAFLPLGFWKYVTGEMFQKYCLDKIITSDIGLAIETYANDSKQKSEQRLAEFKNNFKNILVVEI